MFLSHFKSQAGKRFLKTFCKYEMKLFCQKNNLFLDKLCFTERRTHLHMIRVQSKNSLSSNGFVELCDFTHFFKAFPLPVNGGIHNQNLSNHCWHKYDASISQIFWFNSWLVFTFGPISRGNLSQKQAKPTSYFIPVPGNKDVKVDWKLFFQENTKKNNQKS